MIRIAVVENEREDRQRLCSFVADYAKGHGSECEIAEYENGLEFISGYRGNADCVFMDIMMPHMDGMETAKRLREIDRDVPLVFTTNMASYAVQGYRVAAQDFLIKPVSPFDVAYELEKALREKERHAARQYLWLSYDGTLRKIYYDQITYVDIVSHDACIHTERDGQFTFRSTLKSLEERLDRNVFSRCSSGYIVNMQKVAKICDDTVFLTDGAQLKISRARKKEFMGDFTRHMGRATVIR